eukprot:jgi/Psemu1/192605/e_gw1.130.109.1
MTEVSTGQQGDGGGGGRGTGGRGGGKGNKSRGGRGGGGRGGRGKKNNEKKEANKGGDAAKNAPKPKNDNNNNNNNKGGGEANKNNNRNRRRNNQNKSNKKGGDKKQKEPVTPKITKEEEERIEQERLRKIEEEAERKRLEEEEKAKQARLEIRLQAEKELNERFQEAMDHLKTVTETSQTRTANRNAMSSEDVAASRKEFEASKKSLKSDLKKCTAFVKKIKTGGAWSMTPDALVKDASSLNLSRYVEEVVAAVLEAKLKLTDIPVVLVLCKSMNLRYTKFLPAMVTGLWSVVHAKPTDNETSKLRRVYVRLLTELLLNGLTTETKPLMKLIAEASGGKDGSYNVTDASMVVAFVKAAGFEILGTRPTSIQKYSKVIEDEILRHDENKEDGADEEDESNLPVLISEKQAADGKNMMTNVNELIMDRAVSSEISNKFLVHCKGAYEFLSKSLVQTDTKLQKMEKRCEQDRLLAGSLTEAREKGLQDARKLRESLERSVEAMSDIMDLPLPKLEKEAEEETEGGTGVEVWTKDGSDEDGTDFGPFDDEETRAFYCDVPDFLTTVPPALLGLTQEDIDKRKALNEVKFGAGFGPDNDSEGDTATDVVAPSSEAELEAVENGEDIEPGDDNEETKEENKDAPHYKLMVLLEQELPECSRREQIDEISEKFCTNHGSSKNARKRLSKTLFHVPRARLDLLPYYSRMAATLCRVWPDIGDVLLVDLEQQFHGQAKFKKNQNIESRMRTARYIGELTIFRMAPPIVALRCLRRCMDDFTGGNVDIACCLLESCGRYLYRLPHTNKKLNNIMETMLRLSKAKRLEERSLALIKTAMYTVKPPTNGAKKEVKEYPPLEGYLRYILMENLQPTESSISFVSKQLLRFPWADPSMQCGALICKIMLKSCRNGRYKAIEAVANVAAKLRRQKPEVCIRLLDDVVEELQWSIEHPAFKDQQRTLTVARLLGELYVASLASGQLIFQQLYRFINFGHEIPDALREASEKATTSSESLEESLPMLNSASGVSGAILEDEEMDQDDLEAKVEEKEEMKEEVQPVAVSFHSKYDPRVFSALDPPNSVFRVKLVCVLLEVVSKKMLVTKNNIPKIEAFLASFQRYLFTKNSLPTEVEFALLDTFDVIDSKWREVLKDQKKKNSGDADNSQGFRRYRTWLEAHNATIANEEAEAAMDRRAHMRLEALAGNSADAAEVSASDLLNEEDELEDDEDYDSDAMSVDSKDSEDDSISVEEKSNIEDRSHDNEESSDDDDDSDDDSDESDDEDSEEEFDEDAYMRQLEEEAFEAELRRLTMDALEKGKSTSRGGKVSDNMVSGSQFIKKKQPDAETSPMPTFALGGMEGISFNLLKKGSKGKMEAKQFFVPKDTNLAAVATKQDDEAAKERDMIKARVLQYEAESAISEGNVYLEQEKLQVIRNRPLSMEEIDKNFGTTGGNLVTAPNKKASPVPGSQMGGRGGRGYSVGRGGGPFGRGGGNSFGRLGGRGRGRSSGRGLV